MKPRIPLPGRRSQRGATLIEILVAMIILMVGLLGLIGVMIQSQRAQLESYQRMQALLLVQDLAARIAANKLAASCYVTATYIGTGNTTVPAASACTATATSAQKNRVVTDMTEWRDLLLGASETSGTDKVGAILGARGCVTKDASSDNYQVSVAWQGSAATGAPPDGIACAKDLYGDDAYRRAVSVTVQLPNLSS
jgi:type IV pilus assembly protein PilV